ncbi:hypothetical protein [Caminibacter pacificus]|jgi:hypothetical protein
MAYKWEKGRVKRVSLPKKLSKENKKLLEEYWENTKSFDKELDFLKKLDIKTVDADSIS